MWKVLLKSATGGEGKNQKYCGQSAQGAHEYRWRLMSSHKGDGDGKNRTKIQGKPDFIIFVYFCLSWVTSLLSKCTFLTRNEIFTNYKLKFYICSDFCQNITVTYFISVVTRQPYYTPLSLNIALKPERGTICSMTEQIYIERRLCQTYLYQSSDSYLHNLGLLLFTGYLKTNKAKTNFCLTTDSNRKTIDRLPVQFFWKLGFSSGCPGMRH